MKKSRLDVAYEIIKEQKEELSFNYIWAEVSKQLGYSSEEQEDKISDFYTDILLDSRFVTLGENCWDLRENHSFDKVHIDMNDIYTSDDVIEIDEGLIAVEDIDDELYDDEDDKEESLLTEVDEEAL